MDEKKMYQAAAGWLKSAVDILQGAGVEVIAPIETDPGVFELTAVNSSESVVVDYANVRLPLKRLFFPNTEVLLEFEGKPDGDVDVKSEPLAAPAEVVVLGARPCGVAALEALDKV
ncbi:MAG: hypothetical protein ACYSWO_22885 [Planctomycetota bacterium]